MASSGNVHYGKRTLVSLFNVCFLHTRALEPTNRR